MGRRNDPPMVCSIVEYNPMGYPNGYVGRLGC